MYSRNCFGFSCKEKRSLILLVLMMFVSFSLLTRAQSEKSGLTADQIFNLIKEHTGGSSNWSGNTVDTFKAGDSTTVVTGIVTTFTPTMDVLKKAVAANCNFIISHEPTFYNHTDNTSWLTNDPVFKTKLDYINQHHLVICRFHDHIHSTPGEPDRILKGTVDSLRWQNYQSKDDPEIFNLPETSLTKLAKYLKSRLKIKTIRVIGDPDLKITRAAFLPGAYGGKMHIQAFEKPGVQVLLVGESNEWEGIAYAVDASQQKKGQAMILLGHVPSEEPGMAECARWLKTFITNIPIKFISAGEPFWLPE
jgi:putative NIF3 family GTP cyclohydrolase 1 type 2